MARSQSPESNEKRRIAMTGRRHSAEARAKMSAAKKGRPAHNRGVRMTAAQRVNSGRRPGCTPWNKGLKTGHAPWLGKKRGPASETTKAKMRAAAVGKPKSASHVANILAAWCPGRRQWYRGIALRSTYEVRLAKAFDARGTAWCYEPTRFDLGSCSYTPDFYLPESGVYWEAKGYLGSSSIRKIDLLRSRHPDIVIVLATLDVIRDVERGATAYPGLPSPDSTALNRNTSGQFAIGMKPSEKGEVDGGRNLEDRALIAR